ncbi:MAG: type II secretion system protein [Candidatus Paceibacterota bacterium]
MGMTYVELIVVLSIFATMTSIVLFNYNTFQAKVDIKNLANDIALKIVEAQKAAVSGKWNPVVINSDWKPTYGVYLDKSDYTTIVYFNDLSSPLNYIPDVGETLDSFKITKGNSIFKIESYIGSTATSITESFSISFTRPSSSAIFRYDDGLPLASFDYMQITVSSSDRSVKAYIKVYPSGRIQIN